MVRTVLKLVAGLAIAYAVGVLVLFAPILLHDDRRVRERDLQRVLDALGLERESVTTTRSYLAPPGWSGDYSLGFCLALASSLSESSLRARGFRPGDAVGAGSSEAVAFLAEAAQGEMPWVPAAAELLTPDYHLHVWSTGPQAAALVYLPRGGDPACYLAIKY